MDLMARLMVLDNGRKGNFLGGHGWSRGCFSIIISVRHALFYDEYHRLPDRVQNEVWKVARAIVVSLDSVVSASSSPVNINKLTERQRFYLFV